MLVSLITQMPTGAMVAYLIIIGAFFWPFVKFGFEVKKWRKREGSKDTFWNDYKAYFIAELGCLAMLIGVPLVVIYVIAIIIALIQDVALALLGILPAALICLFFIFMNNFFGGNSETPPEDRY